MKQTFIVLCKGRERYICLATKQNSEIFGGTIDKELKTSSFIPLGRFFSDFSDSLKVFQDEMRKKS